MLINVSCDIILKLTIKNKMEENKMEKITFFCYPRCSTCQKAKKWLEENKIEFTEYS